MTDQSIAERFEEQVALYPERPAASAGGSSVSYRELNRSANRIARAILEVAPDAERVVLLFDQGVPVVAAALGVLKAGKTYVPLDPSSPPLWLEEMVEDSEASVLLCERRHLPLARRLARPGEHVVVDADETVALSWENLGLRVSPDAVAYMLYTSGSTGRPKGVVQTHRNLLHFVRSHTAIHGITSADRVGWLHSMTFSATNMNVYPAILNGAAFCPYDVKSRGVGGLARLLIDERVTVCQCVPTVFRHFLAGLTGAERFADLRVWELGGEPVFRSDVDRFREHFPPGAVLVNRLAFTEASVAAYYRMDGTTGLVGSAVPVGRPADGVEILLRGESGAEVAPGEVGEIVLRSRHLSPGYWRRPDLTAAAFQPDPDQAGRRTYRTGDLGRVRSDGLLEYFGRKDFRVKVRGYTIEVAEIEAVLLASGIVSQAVVVAREDQRGDNALVAYLVPAGDAPPSSAELRLSLAERLPDYMIPAAFVALDALPVTSTGKLDRLALPAPERSRPEALNGYLAPRTPREHKVAAIWAEVFGLDRVGVNDDFFELGGHSLLAGRIAARIRQSFGKDLPMGILFDAPTVAELCRQLDDEPKARRDDRPVGADTAR